MGHGPPAPLLLPSFFFLSTNRARLSQIRCRRFQRSPPFSAASSYPAPATITQTLRPRRPHPKTLSSRACSAASTAARPRRRRLRGARHPGLHLRRPSIVSIAGVEEDNHHPHPDSCLLAKRAWPTTAPTPRGVCSASTKPCLIGV
jgi:beta-phosphoglucomutase-like phosphatase (HAD superfamily)